MNTIERRSILFRLRKFERCRIYTDDGKVIEGYPNNYIEGETIFLNQRKNIPSGRQVNELSIKGIEIKKGKQYRRVL